MSKVNYSKGLLRLWVVLAVCWVSATSVWKFPHLTAQQVGYYDEATNHLDQCQNPRDWLDVYIFCDKNPKSKTAHMVAVANWQRRSEAISWILLPPAMVLLLGNAGVWVLRGFRSPGTQSGQ